MAMPCLLIIWHSRTGASAAIAEAAEQAARDAAPEVTITRREAEAVDAAAMLAADAYLFVGPENLAALSGAMKELCDRCYYPLLGQIEGRSYAHIIAAGSDGEGAARQLARIATGWRLKPVAEPLIVRTDAQTPEAITAPKWLTEDQLTPVRDLAAAFAAGLAIGMY